MFKVIIYLNYYRVNIFLMFFFINKFFCLLMLRCQVVVLLAGWNITTFIKLILFNENNEN